MKDEGKMAPIGILSADEEFALSMLREVLNQVRPNGHAVAMGLLEQAIANAGAQVECSVSGPHGKVFRIKSARFAIQSGANSKGTFDVIFIEDEP
jgi:hypothetical protein